MCQDNITLEQIYEKLIKLEEKLEKLKEWSDLNDYWLRDMIDSHTECLNQLLGISEEDTGGPYHILSQ